MQIHVQPVPFVFAPVLPAHISYQLASVLCVNNNIHLANTIKTNLGQLCIWPWIANGSKSEIESVYRYDHVDL